MTRTTLSLRFGGEGHFLETSCIMTKPLYHCDLVGWDATLSLRFSGEGHFLETSLEIFSTDNRTAFVGRFGFKNY